MNFTSMPSLKQASLTKVAIILWNQEDIGTSIERLSYSSCIEDLQAQWQEIENKVSKIVSELLLPEILKNKILDFIKPIGDQVLEWMSYHVDYLGNYLPDNMSWTFRGTIDKMKTAEVLVNDESLDITKRYKLACIYCLKNKIRQIWNKIPENRKRYFYCANKPDNINQNTIVTFWTYRLKRKLNKLPVSCYMFSFETAMQSGNKAATEYFFRKLTHQERKEVLVRSARFSAAAGFNVGFFFLPEEVGCSTAFNSAYFSKERYIDNLRFLLYQMNAQQKMKVFKFYPYYVLKCLLVWPWQQIFMEAAKMMWNFLPEYEYDKLLLDMVDKVIMGYRDYNYQNLFGMFWKESPDSHKKYVIDQFDKGSSLSKLFEVNDKQNILLMLNYATVTQRAKIIFHNVGQEICKSLICHCKWDMLQLFIVECISSKALMMKFRGELQKRVIRLLSKNALKKENKKLGEFFQFLDNLFQDDKKRILEASDCSPAKKRIHYCKT